MCPTGGVSHSLSLSLVETAEALKNNPLHSDLLIVSENRSYHAHKFILYARSRKWGRDSDLSSTSVLDWGKWSNQTIEDLLDYIYLDQVSFLTDGRYDDGRTIKLYGAASYYSLDQLVAQCDQSLLDSKNRHSLPPDSAAVLTAVALSVKKKSRSDIKPKSRKSLLRVQSTQNDHDPYHDHNYFGIQKQGKKRKLNQQEDEEAVSEKRHSSPINKMPNSSSAESNVTNPSQSASNQGDQVADNKAELSNAQREPVVNAGASVSPLSGPGAMVSQA